MVVDQRISMSLTCDSIVPRHGQFVTVNGASFAPQVWSTATTTSACGPSAHPQSFSATCTWSVDADGTVTLLWPEMDFQGGNDENVGYPSILFDAIAALPPPARTAVANTLCYDTTATNAMLRVRASVSLGKRVSFILANNDFEDTVNYHVAPTVIRYKTNPLGNWSSTSGTASCGPTAGRTDCTWGMFYCTEPGTVHFSIEANSFVVGDATNSFAFSKFNGLPGPAVFQLYHTQMLDNTLPLAVQIELETDSSIVLTADTGVFGDGDICALCEFTGSYAT